MIKDLVEVKKITLPVNGREMTFSEDELIDILEKHFNSEIAERETTEVTQISTESKYFSVNPTAIDQNLFEKKRDDPNQECTRQTILEAFIEVKNNPEKYAKSFKIMIPEKTWSVKTVEELEKLVKNVGGHITNWVEQALEWAQRIANGETWEAICNEPDIEKWYRLVIWKNDNARLVGGSSELNRDIPASVVVSYDCTFNVKLHNTVPSVVLYDHCSAKN